MNQDITSLKGQLLAAMPGMSDPRFDRAVIFMIEHDEKGSMGIIINKPFDAIIFGDLLEQLNINISGDISDKQVLFGGPMDIGRGFVLHSSDIVMGHTERMSDDLALTTSMDILCRVAENSGPEKNIFALGYAGWSAGQLEDEIRQNAWITCHATADIIFDTPLALRWDRTLATLGIDPEKLSGVGGTA